MVLKIFGKKRKKNKYFDIAEKRIKEIKNAQSLWF